MSDDVKVGIDPRGAEAGSKRVVAAFKAIQDGATKHVGGAGRSFSNLYAQMNKFSSLKGVNSNAIKSLQDLSSVMTALSRSSGPSATAINNIRGLSSALSGFKAPSASQIRNLNDFGTALRNITGGPTTARVAAITGLSGALAGFKAPSQAAVANLSSFFNVLNNAKFSSNVSANLRNLATSVSGLAPFAAMANQMAGSMNNLSNASQNAGKHFLNLRSQGLSLSQTLLRTHAALEGMVAVLGARSIVNAATEYQKMELALKATLNSTVQAAAEMNFAQGVADKYGVSIASLGGSYAQLLASAQGTNITVEDSRRIFEGVTQAVRVYGLSTTDAEGVYRALTQIVSKGTVQMEELRGQLGDRLPGAVQIFAKGLGVSTAELMKMTQAGEVTGETLRKGLLGFSDELKRRTSGAVDEAVQSLPAALGRLQTAFINFSDAIVKGGFGEGLTKIIDGLAGILSNSAVIGVLNGLGAAFSAAASNATLLATLGLGALVIKIAPAVSGFVGLHLSLIKMSQAAGGLSGYFGVLTGAMTRAQIAAMGLNVALGVIAVAAVAFTMLQKQLDLGARAARNMEKSTQELNSTVAASVSSVEELAVKYKELNEAQRTTEYTKLQNSMDQATAATDKLGASVEKMGRYAQVLRDNNLGQYVSAIQNPAKASTTTLTDLVDKLNSLRESAGEAGNTELAGFAGTLADLITKFLSARDRIYDLTVWMNMLKGQSVEQARHNAEMSLGFTSVADTAGAAADKVSGLSAAMKTLNEQKLNVQGLQDAIKAKDKAAVAAYIGRSQANQGEQKNISDEADLYARGELAKRFNLKTSGDWFNNEKSVGKQLYNRLKTQREGELYQQMAEQDFAEKDAVAAGRKLLGWDRTSSSSTRTRQDPYSVDRGTEAVSKLRGYLDPDQKANKARLEVEQSINLLLKENPKYLTQMVGATDKLKAADTIRQQAYEQIAKNLSGNVPELRDIASAEDNYRNTVDSINELYELRSDLIATIGEKEELLAQAARRRDTDIAEAAINNIKRVQEERRRAFEISSFDPNRALNNALSSVGLGGVYGTRKFGGEVDGKDVGTAIRNNMDSIQLQTSEMRIQQTVSEQMLGIYSELSARYGEGSEAYKRLGDQAKELLETEMRRVETLNQMREADDLIRQYPTFSERNSVSAMPYQEDYNRMKAMSEGGVYNGVSYDKLDASTRASAADHLDDIGKAYQRAAFNASTFGQTVNAVMDRAAGAIEEFVTTGKLDFASLVSDVIAQVMRLAIIQPIVDGLSRSMAMIFGGSIGGLFGFLHNGGEVGGASSKRIRLHSGGIVPRGGVSTGDLRSWEYMTQLPRGAEVITQYDRRHQNNPRFGDTMAVLLKANEEVLMPGDPRRLMKSYHTGGVVGEARQTMDDIRSGGGAGGGGVSITNNITLNVPANASRGPADDGRLARQLAEELTRQQDTQLRVALQYRNRNSRTMKVS